MATVVVTGGAGYIGCWACRKLVEAGHAVKVVDKGFFPSGMAYVNSLPGVSIWASDIRDFDLQSLSPFDAVIHLAGLSNDPSSEYSPVGNDEMNRVATERICEQAAAVGCKRFIFASSASVYGFNDTPKLDETAPINPCSLYAESKAKAEEYVWDYANDIGGVILRQGTVMGWSPRHRNDLVVNAMTRSAIQTGKIVVNAGGEAFRPLLDVQDLAEAYCRLLQEPAGAVVGETLNLAHRRSPDGVIEGYTIACLALWIKEVLASNHGIEADVVGNWSATEGRSYDISSERIRTLLGWEPMRGVTAAVAGIVEHRGDLGRYDQVNIEWLKAMEHGQQVAKQTGSVFVS